MHVPRSALATEHHRTAALPEDWADMHGWPELASTVARVYYALPERQRDREAIVASNYGEAAAIDFFGARFGLPPAISKHNNYDRGLHRNQKAARGALAEAALLHLVFFPNSSDVAKPARLSKRRRTYYFTDGMGARARLVLVHSARQLCSLRSPAPHEGAARHPF